MLENKEIICIIFLCIRRFYELMNSVCNAELFMSEFRIKQFLENVIIRFRFKDEPSKYLP